MASQVPVRIVDCDVHLVPTSRDELLDRMPEPWRSRLGARRANATGKATYASFEKSKRKDSFPPGGGLPGSEPEFVYRQLFGDSAVDLAMVIPEGRFTVDPELNTVWCAAHNAWLSATWLDRLEPRRPPLRLDLRVDRRRRWRGAPDRGVGAQPAFQAGSDQRRQRPPAGDAAVRADLGRRSAPRAAGCDALHRPRRSGAGSVGGRDATRTTSTITRSPTR